MWWYMFEKYLILVRVIFIANWSLYRERERNETKLWIILAEYLGLDISHNWEVRNLCNIFVYNIFYFIVQYQHGDDANVRWNIFLYNFHSIQYSKTEYECLSFWRSYLYVYIYIYPICNLEGTERPDVAVKLRTYILKIFCSNLSRKTGYFP